jgi:endonuclease III
MNPINAIKQLDYIKNIATKEMRLAAQWPNDWQVLISTILSAQTKDETTIRVCEVLFKKYNSLAKLGNAQIKDIEKIIHSVNYHRTKAKNIISTAKILSKKSIPEDVKSLIELPGVGRKTANVFLAEFHKKAAIGVDTHVAFVSQYLGWTNNKDSHKIEQDLEELFPRGYWNGLNDTIVRFGRSYNRKEQMAILDKINVI